MDLAAVLSTALPTGQAAAEALMLDTFTAYKPDGTTPVDGLEVQAYSDKGETLGKIQGQTVGKDTSGGTRVIGGVERPIITAGLHLPLSAFLDDEDGLLIRAGDIGVGWEFQCTETGTASDPSLVGRRYLVVNVPAKAFATARRLDVVELPTADPPEPDEET